MHLPVEFAVDCPTCSARRGRQCDLRGTLIGEIVHVERIFAYLNWQDPHTNTSETSTIPNDRTQ